MTHGITFPTGKELPDMLIIQHVGTDQEYSFPLQWTARGTAETTWKIPENAKLGTYRTFLLQKGDKSVRQKVVWNTGSFEVQEFRPLIDFGVQKNLINERC